MTRYNDYMDNLEASDTLHERLKHLEEPKKKPQPWVKWGSMAAAFALIVGAAAWGLGRMIENTATVSPEAPAIGTAAPEGNPIPDIADIPAPFPAGPNDPQALPDRTDGGYEVVDGDMVAYYLLPALNWADASALTQGSMDYQLAPSSAVSRDATWDDVQLFAGGEKAMRDHLLWEGLTWGGTLWFSEDGTPCAASLYADGNGMSFTLEVMLGYDVPSCVVLPEEHYEISRFHGTRITAVKNGGYMVTDDGVELNEKREISFYFNGAGYKLTLYAADAARADELCARFVRYAVDGGFHLDALTVDGADFVPHYDLGNEDSDIVYPDCPYCADGTVHTHPYDPGAPAAPPYSPVN